MYTLFNETWQNQLPKIPNETFDLIIIDPPYLTTSESWDQQEVVNETLAEELLRVAKPNCSLYVWCGIGEKSQSLIRWFPLFTRGGWKFKQNVVWAKQRGIGMIKGWLFTQEHLMWFVKDNKKFVWNKEEQYSEIERPKTTKPFDSKYTAKSPNYRISNVWTDIKEESWNTAHKSYRNVGHFTPKPEKAIERIIKLHTQPNDLILDCFAGSGTTGYCAEKLGRNSIMIEMNPEYCELIESRMKSI